MSNWMIPFDDLNPSQKALVKPLRRAHMWLIGFPGSGKSVVLTHIAREAKEQGKKVAVVTYTKALGDLFYTGLDEINSDGIPVMTPRGLMKRGGFYDYIVCDEIQDLSLQTLREIRSKCTYLIAAGDANQSIYSTDIFNRPVMTGAAASSVLQVESDEQNIIYRLTRSMVEAAISICPNLAGMRNKINQTGIDTRIMRRHFSATFEESRWVYDDAYRFSSRQQRTAVLFSTREGIIGFANEVLHGKGKRSWQPRMNEHGRPDFNNLNSHLLKNGIRMQCVLNDYGSLKNAHNNGGIILTTYHSAKGLDFENVYLPALNRDLYLLADQEKSKVLLMVALTRSSKNLTLSYSSTAMSGFILPITNCTDINMTTQQTPTIDDDMF